MNAVTHLEKVIVGEVSAVTHLEKVIAGETSAVTYTEKVITGEATPITHLQRVIAGVESPVTHLEYVWAGRTPEPTEHEYTGAVPVTFNADGTPLLEFLISGNMQQTGTPTPTTPIQPQETGERTGNLCPDTGWRSGQYRDGVWETTNTRSTSDFFPVSSNQYRLKINAGQLISFINFNYFDNQKQWLGNRTTLGMSTFSPTAQNIVIPQLPSNAAYMSITIRFYNDNGNPPIPQSFIDDSNIMVSEGTSEPSYEPYGYKIPISSASTTTPVYLGEIESTRQIKKLVLTGEETSWSSVGGNAPYRIILPDIVLTSDRNSVLFLSTHYLAVSNNASWSQYNTCVSWAFSGNANVKCLQFRDTNQATLADFKSYLQQQYAAGTPVTVWYVLANPETAVVNEPIRKIGDYADTVSMEQAGVSIPTNNGSTTVDVETTLKPSEVYIKWKGV